MSEFAGIAVVVTGGTGGIGAAVSRRFASEGAAVFVCDLDPDSGERVVAELGGRARFIKLDVTKEADWIALHGHLAEKGLVLGALINCAGAFHKETIERQAPETFRKIMDVNVFGTWLGMHVLGPALRASKRGVIVNISSTQGIRATALMGAYATSKWAVRGLTKTAALEFAPDGVRVCSVHPGPIRTAMTAGLERTQVMAQPIPRFGEPDEVASMVWFVASQATYSTGSEFLLDGGKLLGYPADQN